MSNARRYVSAADAAKMLRAELKAAFPAIKFRVRSKNYSGGASIDVSYTDGPTHARVNEIAQKYAGASFDGMQDLKSYHSSIIDGEEVHFSSDFVFVSRNLSPRFVTKLSAMIAARYGIELPAINDGSSWGASVAATTTQDRECMAKTSRYWNEKVRHAAENRLEYVD